MPTTRRKPRDLKAAKYKVRKTDRRELPPETKAYAVGAMSAGVSRYNLAKKLSITQSDLSRLLTRTKERSEASKLPLWDPQLYATEPGPAMLMLC
ncbi:hypothetical protein PMIN01_13561 [Paraphaeosphaeria minitans]|uniref:Uncharacterized protein n=1 Tax=Paraphaeosphaeria minitans TaxID=565426 RepID=A0A9P6G4N5_9PLEO|nr:hypothetical protein PMIN01_13561 [Paraphaeosphaeria minitans]